MAQPGGPAPGAMPRPAPTMGAAGSPMGAGPSGPPPGPPPGGQSGGFPARPAGQGPNRSLLVALGIVAVAAVAALGIIASQSGGGGSDEAGGDTTTTTTTTTSSTGVTGTGYSEEIEAQFVDSCEVEATRSQCQCIYDRLEAEVPFERFAELSLEMSQMDQSQLEDTSNVPEELQNAALACLNA